MCLDSGSFMMNYSGCAKCGENSQISSVNRQTSEEDGEETITYQRITHPVQLGKESLLNYTMYLRFTIIYNLASAFMLS